MLYKEVSILKNFLKNLKLHESTISTVLGFLVIVVVGLLVVNYFRNIDTGETSPKGTSTEQAGKKDTYTVAAGDTLWSISEKVYGSGYNWVDIRDANNIDNPNNLDEGTELTIPDVEARGVNNQIAIASTTPKATTTPSPSPTPKATEIAEGSAKDEDKAVDEAISTPSEADKAINAGSEYTVMRGDNLWNIAVAAYGDGYRWVDIAKANSLVNPSVIHAGNVLTIPS